MLEEAGDGAVDKAEVGCPLLVRHVDVGGAEGPEADKVAQLLLEVEISCGRLILGGTYLLATKPAWWANGMHCIPECAGRCPGRGHCCP